jgi:hypothetical protein
MEHNMRPYGPDTDAERAAKLEEMLAELVPPDASPVPSSRIPDVAESRPETGVHATEAASITEIEELEGPGMMFRRAPDLTRPRTESDAYRFPVGLEPGNERDMTPEDLIGHLQRAVARIERQRPTFPKFESFRKVYCLLSLELNRRHVLPPSFRPRLSPPHKDMRTEFDNTFHLDATIIDLHWWFLHGRRIEEFATVTLKPLFPDFSITVAENFATLKWPMKQKVEAMRLCEVHKWFMAAIRDKEIAARRRQIAAKVKALRHALSRIEDRRWANTAEDWPRLYEAEMIAIEVSKTERRKVRDELIKNIYNEVTGKTLLRQSISVKRKRLEHFRALQRL